MENNKKWLKFKEILTDNTKLRDTMIGIGIAVFLIAFSIYILNKQGVINAEEKTTKSTSIVSTNNIVNDNTTPNNAKKTVKSGRLSEIITPNEYGDDVQYSANGIDDWKIFYNDNENVFIISSEYIITNNIPTDILNLTTENAYSVYWKDGSYLKSNYNGPIDISADIAQKYKLSWFLKFQSEFDPDVIYGYGHDITAALLNTNVWNCFVDINFAESAIGGPTLDMFIESWNQKQYLTLYQNSKSNGYYISRNQSKVNYEYVFVKFYNLSTEENVSDDIGYKDKLYFPYNEKIEGTKCYALASPGGYVGTVMGVFYTGLIGTSSMLGEKQYEHDFHAFRPVVCLKSNVIGIENEDGYWSLEI